MSNHFHPVLETPGGNLVAGMKWLLGTYTMRFNRKHRYSGHSLTTSQQIAPSSLQISEFLGGLPQLGHGEHLIQQIRRDPLRSSVVRASIICFSSAVLIFVAGRSLAFSRSNVDSDLKAGPRASAA